MDKKTRLTVANSISKFIEGRTGIPSHIAYDGFEYPDEKPFVIVEFRRKGNEQLSKLRESVSVTLSYQIGVYAESEWDLSEYQDELSDLFMFESIPFINKGDEKTRRHFVIDSDFSETTLPATDLTNESKQHRMFFDVDITHVINKRGRS